MIWWEIIKTEIIEINPNYTCNHNRGTKPSVCFLWLYLLSVYQNVRPKKDLRYSDKH